MAHHLARQKYMNIFALRMKIGLNQRANEIIQIDQVTRRFRLSGNTNWTGR